MKRNYLTNIFITRVAGLSTSKLEDLSNNYILQKSLNEFLSLNKSLDELTENLLEIIFNYVSELEDKNLRTFLIKLKRIIYNKKEIPNDFTIKLKTLNLSFVDKIEEYIELNKRLKNNKISFSKKYNESKIKIRNNFKNIVKNSDFKKGLLISSPKLYKLIEIYTKIDVVKFNKKYLQIEQGLLKYASRMIMKSTPFGRFCSIIPGMIDSSNNKCTFTNNPQEKNSIMSLNKIFYNIIKRFLLQNDSIRQHLNIELNKTIFKEYGSFVYLTEIKGKEIFQRLTENEVLNLFFTELSNKDSIPFNALVTLVSDLPKLDTTEDEAKQYLDKLLEIGFLKFKIGVYEQDENWIEKVIELLTKIKHIEATQLVRLLDKANITIKKYSKATAQERLILYEKLNIDFIEGVKTLTKNNNLMINTPFYEDSTSDSKLILSQKFILPLEKLLDKFIKSTIKLANPRLEQITMRHFFDNFYTKDIVEVPLLKFYEDFYKNFYKDFLEKQKKIKADEKDEELENYDLSNPFKLEAIEKIKRGYNNIASLICNKWANSYEKDEINISQYELGKILEDVPSIMNPKPVSLSLFAEIVCDTTDTNKKLVLNNGKYLLGFGKYFSRFLRLFDDDIQRDFYKKNNFSEKKYLYAEISKDDDFNANLHPKLLKFEISYPTSEVGFADKQIMCTDLIVQRNPDDALSLLLIHKPTTEIVIPLDLGFLNPMMRPPLFQLLSKFSPPSNFSINIPNSPKMNKDRTKNEEIIFRPRIIFENRIVISRKTWIVKSEAVPSRNIGEEDSNFFLRLNLWREQENIPDELYFKLIPNYKGKVNTSKKAKKIPKDFYKPQYIDFNNPLMVELFEKQATNIKNCKVIFEERYPNKKQIINFKDNSFVTEQIFQFNMD